MVEPDLSSRRILVTDDDDFTRVLLERAFLDIGFGTVSLAATAAQATAMAGAQQPHVAVLDLDLGPGPTGLDLARHLRSLNPGLGIVILSSYADPRVFRADAELPEGAIYLSKQAVASMDMLRGAVALALEAPGSRRNRAKFGDAAPEIPKISDNQLEIMRLVAEGLSNAEIARRVSLTEPGVVKAVGRLIKQLDLGSDPAANQRVLIAQAFYAFAGKRISRPGS